MVYGCTQAQVRSSVEVTGKIFGMEQSLRHDVNIRLGVSRHLVLAMGPNCGVGSGSYHTKNLDCWKWGGFTTKNPAFQIHHFGSN